MNWIEILLNVKQRSEKFSTPRPYTKNFFEDINDKDTKSNIIEHLQLKYKKILCYKDSKFSPLLPIIEFITINPNMNEIILYFDILNDTTNDMSFTKIIPTVKSKSLQQNYDIKNFKYISKTRDKIKFTSKQFEQLGYKFSSIISSLIVWGSWSSLMLGKTTPFDLK